MKARYIIYCALIALAVFSAPASADGDMITVGDVNSDGMITTADSILAMQMSVGSMPPDIERADVNYDGEVNSLDALMILTMAQKAQKAQVRVNAPDVVSGEFDATIDIYNVVDLDSGQFDLWFDSGVVNVTGVDSGSIDGTVIPVGNWTVMHGTDNWDYDKLVRVVFDMPEVTGVSGSGHIATIHFEVTGTAGDTGVLDLSDGLLVSTGSDEIPALWNDCEVT
ncbi:MAG: dockerin type I domain-containing protein, partial [Euryarchaeota archaeon]|nr:dockerin type I domain-containing protein [Euryarchaeota archaeon]